jgi:RNA polymerase sigma-70 factor (ECF subfamily)
MRPLPARATVEPDDEPDDHLWVADALAGDPAAFRALFDRHAPTVRRFLRDLGRDDAFADEGTQETFVRAHARLATLRDDQRLRPWLLGIARRVFLEELRRRRLRPGPEAVTSAMTEAVTEAMTDEMPGDMAGAARGGVAGPAASPQAELLVAEQVQVFRAALARLSPERRGVLLLRLDHGLSYDEIASVMGLSLAQVRNELHRGRQELRAFLAPYFEESR